MPGFSHKPLVQASGVTSARGDQAGHRTGSHVPGEPSPGLTPVRLPDREPSPCLPWISASAAGTA
jgi:hypothetical protein